MMHTSSILSLVLLAFSTLVLAAGPTAVNLRTAGNFAIVAKTGVSTVPKSSVTGNIALSPAAGSLFTGFSILRAGTFATSTQVTGMLFAADFTSPTPTTLIAAVSDMQTAQGDAAGRLNPNFLNLGAGGIGGLTLTPGLYKWTSGVLIASDVVISGTPLDTWIFQISGTLTVAAAKKITLSGGALARNIVWVVAGSVALGTTSHFEGTIIGSSSVALTTGATMNGRILSQTAVTLQQATLVQSL